MLQKIPDHLVWLFRPSGGHKWKWAGELLRDPITWSSTCGWVFFKRLEGKQTMQKGTKRITRQTFHSGERQWRRWKEKRRGLYAWCEVGGEEDRAVEWVACWGCYLGAGGWGVRESVNPWDIRCLDLASGGREDGLVTTDQLGKNKREGEMGWWRCGEKEESKENINGQTETHMDFSSVSLEPNFTAGVDRIGRERKSACWSSPEKSTLMHEKLLWLLTLFPCSLFNRMHLFFHVLFTSRHSKSNIRWWQKIMNTT